MAPPGSGRHDGRRAVGGPCGDFPSLVSASTRVTGILRARWMAERLLPPVAGLMPTRPRHLTAARVLAGAAGAAAGAYLAYVATAWARFGRPPGPRADAEDDQLDHFMPRYDVVERHHIKVRAPAAVTMQAAYEMDLSRSRLAHAIFKGREVLLGASGRTASAPGLVADMRAIGWGVLAEMPGRELVMGGVTTPWVANPVFRAIPPHAFAAFAEPDLVKIAWTLRADRLDDRTSMFRTETRAVATDAGARWKFRWYWACLSPGIWLIRRAMLRPLKADAERRMREAWSPLATGWRDAAR